MWVNSLSCVSKRENLVFYSFQPVSQLKIPSSGGFITAFLKLWVTVSLGVVYQMFTLQFPTAAKL